MQRRFASVAPTIWTSDTGRAWRRLGPEYQVIGHYLLTNPHASAYGLYYLPMVIVVEETGVDRPTCALVFRTFAEQDFAYYDERSEWAWIKNMAIRQMALTHRPTGREPHVIGLRRWYASLPPNPFLGPFYDYYAEMFKLEERRDGGPWSVPARPALLTTTSSTVALFERWFEHYPKPTGRRAALEEWLAISPVPDEAFTERCIAAVERQKQTPGWVKEGGRYIPEPENWLHKGRWTDEAPELPQVSADDADRIVTYGQWIQKANDDH